MLHAWQHNAGSIAAKQPMVQACESTQQLTINGCNQPKPHNSSVAYSMQYAAFFTKQQQEAFSTWCERPRTGEHTPRHSTADQTETESCSAQCRIASLCLASNKHHRCSLGNPQQPLAPLTPSQQIYLGGHTFWCPHPKSDTARQWQKRGP